MELDALERMAHQVREDILTMMHLTDSGHPGGSLSAVEILTALYFTDVLRVDPKKPHLPTRNRVIMPKGHAAPVLYSILYRKVFFDK